MYTMNYLRNSYNLRRCYITLSLEKDNVLVNFDLLARDLDRIVCGEIFKDGNQTLK